MNNNELIHYGVPGMKWGRRKGRRVASEDYIKTKNIRKKKIYEMSNQDLQTANNRLTLERNYKSLTRKTNRGKKAVTAFIKSAGIITGVVGAAATYKKYGSKAVDKIGDMVVKDLNRKL